MDGSKGSKSSRKHSSTKRVSTGKKKKHSSHNDDQLTTAPSKTNSTTSVVSISSDEDEQPAVKDPFWENLYKGTLTFEGDMYSKVKQRRRSAEDDMAKRGVQKSRASQKSSTRHALMSDDSDLGVGKLVDEVEDLRVDKLLDEVEKLAKSGRLLGIRTHQTHR